MNVGPGQLCRKSDQIFALMNPTFTGHLGAAWWCCHGAANCSPYFMRMWAQANVQVGAGGIISNPTVYSKGPNSERRVSAEEATVNVGQ